jgi:hypothetical protein
MHPLVFDAFVRFWIALTVLLMAFIHCVREVTRNYMWLFPLVFILIYIVDDVWFKYDYLSRQLHYSKNTNGYPHVLRQLHEIYPDRINIDHL